MQRAGVSDGEATVAAARLEPFVPVTPDGERHLGGGERRKRSCGRAGRGSLRGRQMSFDRPILLLTLLVVPLAIAAYLFAERRRMRYAVTFPNLDLLPSVPARASTPPSLPPL